MSGGRERREERKEDREEECEKEREIFIAKTLRYHLCVTAEGGTREAGRIPEPPQALTWLP